MAAHGVPISASQVWRICSALDLKPWQMESWMTSHDPDFWEKAGDVCGLYLNPPENAVVWSVDEKSGMQATSRVNATKPAVPGTGARREFEYKDTALPCSLPASRSMREPSLAGWPTRPARTTSSSSSQTSSTRPQMDWISTASSTTSRPTRPRRWPSSSPPINMSTCISPRHTRVD